MDRRVDQDVFAERLERDNTSRTRSLRLLPLRLATPLILRNLVRIALADTDPARLFDVPPPASGKRHFCVILT